MGASSGTEKNRLTTAELHKSVSCSCSAASAGTAASCWLVLAAWLPDRMTVGPTRAEAGKLECDAMLVQCLFNNATTSRISEYTTEQAKDGYATEAARTALPGAGSAVTAWPVPLHRTHPRRTVKDHDVKCEEATR
jgi:hypothetical protein